MSAGLPITTHHAPFRSTRHKQLRGGVCDAQDLTAGELLLQRLLQVLHRAGKALFLAHDAFQHLCAALEHALLLGTKVGRELRNSRPHTTCLVSVACGHARTRAAMRRGGPTTLVSSHSKVKCGGADACTSLCRARMAPCSPGVVACGGGVASQEMCDTLAHASAEAGCRRASPSSC